jgi:hypothetical protein
MRLQAKPLRSPGVTVAQVAVPTGFKKRVRRTLHHFQVDRI